MKVKLSREPLADGRQSLYLKVYLGNGKYQQKSLKLYLNVEKSKNDKDYNKAILQEAEIIRNQFEIDLLNKRLGKDDPKEKYDNSFINFFDKLVAHRFETGVNYDSWRGAQKHLHAFTDKKLNFDEVTVFILEEFKTYLLKRLKQNSASSYFDKIKHGLHQAYRERIYEVNVADNVKSIRTTNSDRVFLTAEEIKLLIDKECKRPHLKQAFLFSCFTGLRWSDLMNIKWGNVYTENGSTILRHKQIKTKSNEILPLSEDALELMGERMEDDDKIFPKLKYGAYENFIIAQWALFAGIKKHVTPHTARHSFATLLLTNDVGIYEVSKLLGHKDIKTTEIYAKLLDHKKVEAVQKMPKLL